MRNNFIKISGRIISALMAAFIAVSSSVVLTGCGKEKKPFIDPEKYYILHNNEADGNWSREDGSSSEIIEIKNDRYRILSENDVTESGTVAAAALDCVGLLYLTLFSDDEKTMTEYTYYFDDEERLEKTSDPGIVYKKNN